MIDVLVDAPFEVLLPGQPAGIGPVLLIEVYDPTDATTILAPSGAGISEPRPGSYRASRTVSVVGSFLVRWTRSDTSSVLLEQELQVTAEPAGPPLSPGLTLTGLKDILGKELNADDDELQRYLEAAFKQAQANPPYGCGRLLTPDPASELDAEVQRTFKLTGRRVRIPDARVISQVLLDDVASDFTTIDQDDHIVAITLPRDPVPSYYPPVWSPAPALTRQPVVKVTGRFGFTMIPPDLVEGIYELAARYHYEKAAQYADQVEILEGGAIQNYYRQLPDRTWRAFKTYSVPTYAGMTLA